MLVTREPIRRDVPHEEGAWFDFCKLSHQQLRAARKEGTVENTEQMKLYGAEWIKALSGDPDKKKSKKKARDIADAAEWDPSSFGTDAILEMGIVAWSYDQDPSKATIAMLDGATAAWAKREIVGINEPPSEEEVKKVSGDSS